MRVRSAQVVGQALPPASVLRPCVRPGAPASYDPIAAWISSKVLAGNGLCMRSSYPPSPCWASAREAPSAMARANTLKFCRVSKIGRPTSSGWRGTESANWSIRSETSSPPRRMIHRYSPGSSSQEQRVSASPCIKLQSAYNRLPRQSEMYEAGIVTRPASASSSPSAESGSRSLNSNRMQPAYAAERRARHRSVLGSAPSVRLFRGDGVPFDDLCGRRD